MSKTGDIIVLDDERGHYLLYTDRWRDHHSRIYGCYLHIRLYSIDLAEDGKVWLKYDGTDLEIGQQLLDAGVAREDLSISMDFSFSSSRYRICCCLGLERRSNRSFFFLS